MSENLLGDGVDEGHLIEDVESDRSVEIGTTNSSLLLSDLGEDFGVVGEMLEGESDGRRHSVWKTLVRIQFLILRRRKLTLTGEDEGQ